MLRNDAVAEIQEGLKFRTDQFDAIVRRLQRTQFLLEQGKTLPWFLIHSDFTYTAAAGVDIPLPSDFIREVDYKKGGVFYLKDSTSAGVWLQKLDYDEAKGTYALSTSEVPLAYSIVGNSLKVFPTLTASAEFHLNYYAHDASLSSNIENNWLKYAPYLMIGNAGASMAETLGIADSVAEFRQLAQTSMDALFKENILREMTNRQYVLGRNT